MDFMKQATRGGVVDGRSKRLLAVALAIAHRCGPCLKTHRAAALRMGISQEEIDEVVNLATAFGGCTALMFYRDVCGTAGP